MFRTTTKSLLLSIHKPRARQNAWEWARDNVDFSRTPNYDTPIHGPFDPEFMPYWKEPAECFDDPSVSEIWVRKAERIGGSENLILNPMRKTVAIAPKRVLYLSSDQVSTERFFDKRIKLGLETSDATEEKLKRARALGHEIYFEDMDLITTWPKAKGGFKQMGYGEIYVDECSLLPNTSAGLVRKRTDTYTASTIIFLSSPDAEQKRSSKDDPIFYEMDNTDQRLWHMPDPKTKKPFRFEMGGRDCRYGLKWDEKAKRADDTWDLRRVRNSAHYVTPDGTVIKEAKRLAVVGRGWWIPTNTEGTPGKRGYILNSFHSPFKNGDFGQIACAFLEAKRAGPEQLRAFMYTYLAEPWSETRDTAEDTVLRLRCRDYDKAGLLSECEQEVSGGDIYKRIYIAKKKIVLGSVDVQKNHEWFVFREWIEGGDSGLIDYGYAIPFDDIEKKTVEYKAARVGIDSPYRQIEVYEYALRFAAWPMMGRDNLSLPWLERFVNPREGRRGAKMEEGEEDTRLRTFEFNTDIFGTILLNMIRGESRQAWCLYKNVENDYARQAVSMEKVDGVWSKKRGHPQNHLWDCEVMQVVMASVYGFYRVDFGI